MPPKKRQATTLKIGLSQLEISLLDALRAVDGGTYADHVRFAVRYYAKRHPNLARRTFRAFASRQVEPRLEGEALEAFREEARAFFENDVRIPRRSGEQSMGAVLTPATGEFDSENLPVDED